MWAETERERERVEGREREREKGNGRKRESPRSTEGRSPVHIAPSTSAMLEDILGDLSPSPPHPCFVRDVYPRLWHMTLGQPALPAHHFANVRCLLWETPLCLFAGTRNM